MDRKDEQLYRMSRKKRDAMDDMMQAQKHKNTKTRHSQESRRK
jgi:hypothetical protein